VPPNLKFVVDDAEDEWITREKFDLIHARMMVVSFHDWPQFFARAYKQLKPGGYIELQDLNGLACDDDTFTLNPPSCRLAEWWALVRQAFKETGRDMDATSQHKERLKGAGFVDVTVIDFKWPINKWPRDPKMKNIGMWGKENTLDALEAVTMAPLTRALGWTPEEVQMLLQGVRTDIENQGIHAYWDM
jgi:SAM-dependent methyltransferase